MHMVHTLEVIGLYLIIPGVGRVLTEEAGVGSLN